MSSHTPPQPPFPEGQDPDRTIPYRTPHPPRQQDLTRTAEWPASEELGPAAPARSRRGRGWIIALVAALMVGVVAGGAVWAAAKLGGGGKQPHEVLPGTAIGYVRVDLDPAANQKLALFNIARKFSATKQAFSGEDPRKALFDSIAGSAPDSPFGKVDYAKDVEPWLGDRLGLAVLPPSQGSEPIPMIAVQVKDEEAARTGIAKLFANERTGIAFRDGYALITEDQDTADRYVTAASLSEQSQFAEDMNALGEPGVLSFWLDLEQIAKVGGGDLDRFTGTSGIQDPATALVKNVHFVGALRFGTDYAELTGIARGIDAKIGGTETVKLGDLPDTTAAAVGIGGLGRLLQDNWAEIEKSLGLQARTSEQYGLSVPDDLITLLGKSVTLALDGEGLDVAQPKAGLVLATDPAAAQPVLAKLENALAASGQQAPAKAQGTGKMILATSQDYADKLAAAGTLRDSETFRKAVPAAEDAGFALYADLNKLKTLYIDNMSDTAKANLEALRAVGLSGTLSGEKAGFTLRVVVN